MFSYLEVLLEPKKNVNSGEKTYKNFRVIVTDLSKNYPHTTRSKDLLYYVEDLRVIKCCHVQGSLHLSSNEQDLYSARVSMNPSHAGPL